jgi:glutathione S-transferase
MTSPDHPIKLYDFPMSGNAHRVRLLLSLLDLPTQLITVNLREGEQKQPAFLAKNPFGQIPVLEDGPVTLAESTAILVYLACRYDPAGQWLSSTPLGAAQVQRWLALASGPLAQGPAMARAAALFGRTGDVVRAREIGRTLFEVMEHHLQAEPFLVGTAPTIADVAFYAYTARAPEGGIALDGWPALRAWLGRIEALPRFVPMPEASAPG